MLNPTFWRRAAAAACLGLAVPWAAAIDLVPITSVTLASPVFATHAGDGTRRVFIVEQGGLVKVLQPGSSVPTTFLDIRSRLVSGGERGLLGLAFHPAYASNGRFFVFYTRTGDGALVVAEYRVSANPDVASDTEIPLLTVPHPGAANHNGGMLAFGRDGYLYVATGDGGGSNDPSNNAQNPSVLLGKILRLDIDRSDPVAGTPYAVPPDNPYAGGGGRAEIHSIGWRNPWRFSFDRLTGDAWVADVGQGAREEVNTPLVLGGNYGWRVYEGNACTGLDPALCTPAAYQFPRFDYPHTGGRCSVTGGYVYRGSRGTLPTGTYVYGDYCTGEILSWNGSAQSLLLDTALNIAAFGEDEDGELLVVGLGGSVSRLAAPAPCTYTLAPRRASYGSAGGSGTLRVDAPAGCAWTATSPVPWITLQGPATGSGAGSVSYTVAPFSGPGRSRSASIAVADKALPVRQTAR